VSRFIFRLPDLGEGTVDAEIVAWHVQPGQAVSEDAPLVEVMTDKATVEVPAPVSGRVLEVHGSVGERVAVGSELVILETSADAGAAPAVPAAPSAPVASAAPPPRASPEVSAAAASRVLTSPAIRRRAQETGVDLARIAGSGPHGRILREDLDAFVSTRGAQAITRVAAPGPETEEIRIIGLRRLIAERMSESARTIPHFSYIEEVDVSELERLRTYLNARRAAGAGALSYLPFLILALARTLRAHPQCNAVHDAARGVVVRHRAVHVGVATQTPEGLKVPVIRDAQARSLEELAREIRRLSDAARTNKASRAELSGSTITVTSLGKLGGVASTPIINAPELAIIGVNRAVERPVVVDGEVAVRRMMNLSSSFDHRFVDGHDAAATIQTLKGYLEHPATIFMDD